MRLQLHRPDDPPLPAAPDDPARGTAGGEVPPRPLTYETNVGANGEFPEFWQDPGAEGLPDREKTDLLHIAVTRDSVTLNNEIVKRLPYAERTEEIPPGQTYYLYRITDGAGKTLLEGKFTVPALCERCPPGQPDHVRSDGDPGQNEGLQSGGVVFQHRVDMLLKLPYRSPARQVEFRRRDAAGIESQVGAIRLHRG